MAFLTVAAEEVHVGDQLNMGESFAINPNHRWANVQKVKRINCPQEHENHARIVITAGGCDSWFNPKEGVFIQRFEDLES